MQFLQWPFKADSKRQSTFRLPNFMAEKNMFTARHKTVLGFFFQEVHFI